MIAGKNKHGFGDRFRTGSVLAIACLCVGLLSTGHAQEIEPSAGEDLQIKTTPAELLGEAQAAVYEEILPSGEPVSWEVYLPKSDSTELPGVLVYVSPLQTGRIDSRWRAVMDQQNMIYIAANDSGNEIPTIRRVVLATMAVKVLAKQFAFDPEQINVAGFSGGGRTASMVATQYPEAFTGAIYICGVDFWRKGQTPKVDRVIQNRFVFLTGSKDFNRRETFQIRKRYIKAGAEHTKLIVVPGMAHAHPDAQYMTEAIEFLKGQD